MQVHILIDMPVISISDKSEEDLKDVITDDVIQNVWYVKTLKKAIEIATPVSEEDKQEIKKDDKS